MSQLNVYETTGHDFLSWSVFLGFFMSGLTVVGQTDEAFEDIVCKETNAHRHLFNPMLRSNLLTANYDLKYYRFEWEIDPAIYAIKGTATPYFKVLETISKKLILICLIS
ncbi:MAG: hypothetical protein IPO92_13075 [Saprospiraceae bacterium]|nr:hypothetical protein [Saprospiraceae bacterium]